MATAEDIIAIIIFTTLAVACLIGLIYEAREEWLFKPPITFEWDNWWGFLLLSCFFVFFAFLSFMYGKGMYEEYYFQNKIQNALAEKNTSYLETSIRNYRGLKMRHFTKALASFEKQKLDQIKYETIMDTLINKMGSVDHLSEKNIVLILEKLIDSSIAVDLLNDQTASKNVKIFALKFLGENKSLNAVPYLVKLLNEEKELSIKKQMTSTLSEIGDYRAAIPILAVLGIHETEEIYNAAEKIGSVKIKNSIRNVCNRSFLDSKVSSSASNHQVEPSWIYDLEIDRLSPPKNYLIDVSSDITSVACIKSSRKRVTTYGTGLLGGTAAKVPGVVITWYVTVVDIENKKVTATTRIVGPHPPRTINVNKFNTTLYKQGYGISPSADFEEWLKRLPLQPN